MTIRIGIIGSCGAGKSTTAAGVYYKLKIQGYNVELVQESARHQINRGWEYESPESQFRIFLLQKEYEDTVPLEVDALISDSPILLPMFYALYNTENPEKYELALSDLYRMFLHELNRYDFLIFLHREKEYVQDGCRIQTLKEANEIADQLKVLLDLHHVDYIEMKGNETVVDDIIPLVINKIKYKKGMEPWQLKLSQDMIDTTLYSMSKTYAESLSCNASSFSTDEEM